MERLRKGLSPGLLIWLAAAVLMLPLRWLLAWAGAVCVHELGHLAMLKLLKLPVYAMDADASGARITTEFRNRSQEVLCALAGPAAGCLTVLAAPVFPRLAVCALLQSVYNLLPVYPLDGGRAMRCLAGEKAAKALEALCLTALAAVGIYGSFVLRLGLLPLSFAAFTALRAIGRKIPCKEPR